MLAIKWFESNYVKLNQDTCHILSSSHMHEIVFAKSRHLKIWESCAHLKFDEYILTQCKRSGRKLKTLARVSTYLSLERRRTLMKAFIESHFAYCQLTWMFCSNTRICKLHERALRIVCYGNDSIFKDLLKKGNSVSIHHKNIRLLGTDCCKVKNNL